MADEKLVGILGIDESYHEQVKIHPGIFVGVYSTNPESGIRKKGKVLSKARKRVPDIKEILADGEVYHHILVHPSFQSEMGMIDTRTIVYAELLNFFGSNEYPVKEIMIDGFYERRVELFAEGKVRRKAGSLLACSELEQLASGICHEWINKEGKGIPKISPKVEGDARYPIINKADIIAYQLNKYYSEADATNARKYENERTTLREPEFYKAVIERMRLT